MFVARVLVLLIIVVSTACSRMSQPQLVLKALKVDGGGWQFLGKSTTKQRSVLQRDFGGVALKIAAFQVGYLLGFKDNNTKITGVYGMIWETLAETLNFSLQVRKLHSKVIGMPQSNGSWDGLMGYLQRGETHIVPRLFMSSERLQVVHFVHPFGYTGYRLHMRSLKPRVLWWWLLLPFSRPLWLATVGVIVSVAAATYTGSWLAKWLPGSYHSLDFCRDLLHVLGFFCYQGYRWHQRWAAGHVLLTAALLAASILYQAYSAQLITYLTFRTSWEPPFRSLKEMAAGGHDYKLAVVAYKDLHSSFKFASDKDLTLVWKKYVVMVTNGSVGVQLACHSHTAFLSLPESVYIAQAPCQLEIVNRKKFFPTWISSGIVRNFPHREALDISFIRLRETGILRGLILKHVHPRRKERQKGRPQTSQVEFEHVQPILIFYCLALGTSFTLLIAELAYSTFP